METRIFIFEAIGNSLCEKIEGSTNPKKLDDYLKEGWVPMHWADVSVEYFVRYRVVMCKGAAFEAGEFGFGAARSQ